MPTNYPNGLRSRGAPVESIVPPGVNNVYWVDGANGNDDNDGLTLASAWKTIEKFYANDAARDFCYVMPGTYTPASASLPLTPLANQHVVAAIPNPVPNVIINDDGGGSDPNLVDLEVDGCGFDGIRFRAAHNLYHIHISGPTRPYKSSYAVCCI